MKNYNNQPANRINAKEQITTENGISPSLLLDCEATWKLFAEWHIYIGGLSILLVCMSPNSVLNCVPIILSTFYKLEGDALGTKNGMYGT